MTVAPKANVVALVKVKRYLDFKLINETQTPLSMEVEIVQIYKGSEKRKIVRVWGDNGYLCRPYISTFTPSSYYVIAFYAQPSRNDSTGNTVDYFISICGSYWLIADIEKQTAIGKVAKGQKEISFIEIKRHFNSQ